MIFQKIKMEQKKSFKNLIWSKMIYRLMRKIYNNLFIFGDDGILEVPSLKKHLSKIINDLKPDILIVSTPPHSWLRIIPWVKYQYPTLPLIVDFRDGWTSTGLFRANSFMKKKYDNLGKTIFITQDIGLYGSSKSLFLTLKGLIGKKYIKKENLIIIYPKAIKKFSNKKLKEKLSESNYSEFNDLKSWILPFSHVISGIRISIWEIAKSCIRILLFYTFWICKYRKQLKNKNIKLIYLNSITLWPMLFVLSKNIKTIMHIREILDLNKYFSRIAKKIIIKKCYELIAIDEKTAIPFLDCNKKLTIIKNPFEMKMARQLKEKKYEILSEKYGLNPKKIHISLIGSIQAVKGQKLFCDIAKKCNTFNNFEFIVVGNGQGTYYYDFLNIVKYIENMHYIGEVKNIEEIYAITHIVIRCDDFFPLGRTVWEGVYSGCKVLIPYNTNDNIAEIKDYLNKEIFLYSIRDVEAAIMKLKEIDKIGFRIDINLPTGNLEKHINEISKVLKF